MTFKIFKNASGLKNIFIENNLRDSKHQKFKTLKIVQFLIINSYHQSHLREPCFIISKEKQKTIHGIKWWGCKIKIGKIDVKKDMSKTDVLKVSIDDPNIYFNFLIIIFLFLSNCNMNQQELSFFFVNGTFCRKLFGWKEFQKLVFSFHLIYFHSSLTSHKSFMTIISRMMMIKSEERYPLAQGYPWLAK